MSTEYSYYFLTFCVSEKFKQIEQDILKYYITLFMAIFSLYQGNFAKDIESEK